MTQLFTRLFCRGCAPLVARWAEDRAGLSAAERARIEAHLARCPACRAQADSMRRIALMLRADAPPAASPAPDLWARLRTQIEAEAPRPAAAPTFRQQPQRRRAVPLIAIPAGALAAVAVLAAVAYHGGRPAQDQTDIRFATFTPAVMPSAAPPPVEDVRPAPPSARRPARDGAARRAAVLAGVQRAREQARLASASSEAEGRRSRTESRRDDPFAALERPRTEPVLAAAPVVSAPLRPAVRVAPSSLLASETRPREAGSPASVAALSLEPPALKAPRPLVTVASAGSRSSSVVIHRGAPGVGEASPSVRDGAFAASVTPDTPLTDPGESIVVSSASAETAARPADVAVAVSAPSDTPAADAVVGSRRQRGLFSYAAGGGVGNSARTGRPQR
jgi:hypothetical protein